MICPEYQKWWKGVELCDSVCLNPHKWLMISMDCSLLWVRNRMHLIDALAQHPEYLKNEHMHQVNYKDWQVPLGRRFRALKLWFVLRRFGAEGLRQHIRRSIKLAQHAHQLLKEDGRFEMFVPTRMGLVCFYLKKGGRQANEELLKRVNDSGKIFLIHSVVDGQHFLRLSVGGLEIEESNVQFAIQVLQETLDEIEKNATIKKIKN
jgi:aromatic-L-amino-acid decarboxylase